MLTTDLRQHLEAVRRPSGFVLSGKVSRREDVYGRQLTRALEATGVRTHAGRLGHPHILRHTFGSHLAQVGIDLKRIASWMGHESQRMTEGYAHLCPEDITTDIEKVKTLASTLHPVESSIRSGKVLLGTLSPGMEQADLSSETSSNSH